GFVSSPQRGMVEARPGGGTVVASREGGEGGGFTSAPRDEAGLIALAVNRPATTAYLDGLAPLLPRLAKDRRYPALQDYHPPEGPLWARAAVAQWLGPLSGGGGAGAGRLTRR